MNFLDEILEDYKLNGCHSKVNKEGLLSLLDSKIKSQLSEFNDIVYKHTGYKCTLDDYTKLNINKIPRHIQPNFIECKRELRRLLKLKMRASGDTLLNLTRDVVPNKGSIIRCDFLMKECKNVYLSTCTEDSKNLITISFNEFELYLLYRKTKLYSKFKEDFVPNVLKYLNSKGLEVSKREVIMYLMLKAWSSNHIGDSMYNDNKVILDKIDFVLQDLIEDVILIREEMPRVLMTTFIIHLFYSLRGCSLYFYDYDTITLKVHDVSIIDKSIDILKSSIETSELSFIPYRFIVGNSLPDNLKNIESEGVLVNPNGGGLLDSKVFE